MKIYSKITLVGIVITVVIVAGFGIYSSQSGESISDLILENIEALAQSGEGGTNVGYCYIKKSFTEKSGYEVFCNSSINDNTIYPCDTKSLGGYEESSKDRCTK